MALSSTSTAALCLGLMFPRIRWRACSASNLTSALSRSYVPTTLHMINLVIFFNPRDVQDLGESDWAIFFVTRLGCVTTVR